MKKFVAAMTKVENVIMIVTFAIMVACEFLQVVNRNITKFPITWFDEAAIYCMIYMVLIGTEVGLRDGSQIAVTGFVEKFHGRGRSFLNFLSKLVVSIFSAGVLKGSLELMDIQVRTGQVSAALGLPMSVPYFAMVISFLIILIVQGTDCVGALVALIRGKSSEKEEKTA